MRQIKFRAWHIELLDMTYSNDRPSDFWYKVSVYPDMYNIMQFTGLHDKNGKEIYEGDILELIGGTCDFLPCGVYDDQRHEVGSLLAVQVLPSGFTLCLLRQKDCDIPNVVGKVDNYTFWNHARSLEIIGNIYEHPQLLNNGI